MPTPHPRSSSTPPGSILAVVFGTLVLVWSSTWIAIKIGLGYYPPFLALTFRFLIAGPVLILVMKLSGIAIPWQPRHQPFFLGIGLLSFVTSFGVVYWGEQYVTSGLAAVLFATLPLLTGLVSLVLLREERLGRARFAGLLLGLAGVVVINVSDLRQIHPRAPLAAVVILIGPLATAVSTVLSKRRARDFPPLAMAAIPMIYGGIIDAAIWFLFERDRPVRWETPGVLSLLYLTLIGSVVTFGLYYWLLSHVEVGRANLVAYLTPVFALTIGSVVAHEPVTGGILVGGALVLSGVALAGRRLVRSAPTAPAAANPPPEEAP